VTIAMGLLLSFEAMDSDKHRMHELQLWLLKVAGDLTEQQQPDFFAAKAIDVGYHGKQTGRPYYAALIQARLAALRKLRTQLGQPG
jgi:hypothetical protein